VAAPAVPVPIAAPGTTLDGDGGTLVQIYGVVALVAGFRAPGAAYTAQARPLAASVEPVLPAGFRHIDTYA